MTHANAGSLYAYVSVLFSLHKRMIQLAYLCGIPAYANVDPYAHSGTQKPYFDCFNSFFIIFSSNCPFNALFSSFCWSCLPSWVKVAPTMLLYGRVLTEETRTTYALWDLSLLPVCCWRPLLVPFWCSAWLRGGGILSIPSMLLIGR